MSNNLFRQKIHHYSIKGIRLVNRHGMTRIGNDDLASARDAFDKMMLDIRSYGRIAGTSDDQCGGFNQAKAGFPIKTGKGQESSTVTGRVRF